MLEKKDPTIIGQLMIMNNEFKTPLHLAFDNENSKSINLIMKYMASYCS